jgi:hypothetical protein
MPGAAAGDGAAAVDRLAEGVDDATEHRVADGDLEDATGRPHRLALFDVADLAEDDGADRLLVEVQRQAIGAALELEQLVDAGGREARHAGDAVADLDHTADGGDLGAGREALEALAQRGGDVLGLERELCHL